MGLFQAGDKVVVADKAIILNGPVHIPALDHYRKATAQWEGYDGEVNAVDPSCSEAYFVVIRDPKTTKMLYGDWMDENWLIPASVAHAPPTISTQGAFTSGDRVNVSVPLPLPSPYDTWHSSWQSWVLTIQSSEVLTLGQFAVMGRAGVPCWSVDGTATPKPFRLTGYIPQDWMIRVTNIANAVTKLRGMQTSKTMHIDFAAPKKQEEKDTCSCTTRDLLNFGHRCGRLAPIDRR